MKKQNKTVENEEKFVLEANNRSAKKIIELINYYQEIIDRIVSTMTSAGYSEAEANENEIVIKAQGEIKYLKIDLTTANGLPEDEAEDLFLPGYFEDKARTLAYTDSLADGSLAQAIIEAEEKKRLNQPN